MFTKKNNFKKLLWIFIIVSLLLFVIPSGFASENPDSLNLQSDSIPINDYDNSQLSLNYSNREDCSCLLDSNEVQSNSYNHSNSEGALSDLGDYCITESQTNSPQSSSNSNSNLSGNVYYFNSSYYMDGDGSYYNPYNQLTGSRIKSNSTLYFFDGVYELRSGKVLSGVSFIGESAENTIIKYSGSGRGIFNVSKDKTLMLQDITFIGFNFNIKAGSLLAQNVIFKNIVSRTPSSKHDDNYFGGFITGETSYDYYDDYYPDINIINCSFINSTADYGGAVSIDGGNLQISNSRFNSNRAYNYGGALAIINDVSVSIYNTEFINTTSINGEGGAIFILASGLSSDNLTIMNAFADFGGAICSLNSSLTVNRLYAINNSAKYDGGAIYQMYNTMTITSSNFTNNHGFNGGAIYGDNLTKPKFTGNLFSENSADGTGGAIHLLLCSGLTNRNNQFINNTDNNSLSPDSANTWDLYQNRSVNLNIGSGNYTLVYSNYTFDGEIPSYYDLREHGWVTPVKDQEYGGNCWAFAPIAALESSILKATGQSLNLSEENMKNLAALFSDYGWHILTNEGGHDPMALGYLAGWLGPVLAELDEYDDSSFLSAVYDSFTHVQNILYLSRNSFTDNDGIKLAILNYGGVCVGVDMDDYSISDTYNSLYVSKSSYPNHKVLLVGWDDSYSRYNFVNTAPGDGAWIAKNSWADDWGDNGYFYISYYDTVCAEVGNPDASYVFVFNDSVHYDKNYQYDIVGISDYMISDKTALWVENVFEAGGNELLAAVSTYFRKVMDYEIYIYVNDTLMLIRNGTAIPGYCTFNLGNYVPLSVGDKFKVRFKFIGENAEFAISEDILINKRLYSEGISFMSFDGENWMDLYDYSATSYDDEHIYYSQVAAVKAFTICHEFNPSMEVNITNEYNVANIIANVYDSQYPNAISRGTVIFNIEGIDYPVVIENTVANLTHVFDNIGLYNVTACFGDLYIYDDINITNLLLNFDSTVNVDKNNVLMTVGSNYAVNTSLRVLINDEAHYVNITGGFGSLSLEDLDFGFYEVTALVEDDVYLGGFNSSFNITISKSKIIAENVTVYYTLLCNYTSQLMDIYNNPVSNQIITFVVNNRNITAVTDDFGFASTVLDLNSNESVYQIDIYYGGSENYFPSNSTTYIELKSTVNFLTDSYLVNSVYQVTLLDENGTPIPFTQFSIVIDRKEYWYFTDDKGVISFTLNLKTGNHNVTVKNRITGEESSQTIGLVYPIMENQNIIMYYLSGTKYGVRLYGRDGKAVGANQTVKITLNKKTYNIKTNDSGYAYLTITLKPGNYTIKATYGGYTVSNKVTVKPVLSAKNISRKKAKKIAFQAKLLTTAGKAAKGKYITFKVNKKTYKAKTNAKGIATVYIPNLKVGKYTITSSYGKSTIKNKITVKK